MPSSLTSTSSSTTTFSSSSAGITMPITNATKASYLSPKEDYLTDQHAIFSSSTYSPVELAPILNISDNRPPSPDSPKLRKFTLSNLSYYNQQHCPPFLEPTPQLKIHDTGFFPLDLFKVFKTKLPMLRRSASIQSLPSSRYSTASPPVSSATTTSIASTKTVNDSAMSPIMAAASASAAAAANHRQPGSHVAKTLLESIGNTTTANYADQQVAFSSSSTKSMNKKQAAIAAAAAAAANADQSMFLTKNAHIKRPRNAWIHFRCHYGQALKSQDPTLRAEEISKRASRRWGKLSENEKRPWHGLAEQEKLAHREAFPEYRYCPRRANSSSSATAPPSPPHNLTNNRPRSASQLNTPLNMHDFNHSSSSRAQKRMKRMK
ncbi:hypothetical protein BD408DRAFT_485827 [Parasitella parasitica]|nr:hypothetical protein BD408DRAFT_485827 [Parasitella parasitica]